MSPQQQQHAQQVQQQLSQQLMMKKQQQNSWWGGQQQDDGRRKAMEENRRAMEENRKKLEDANKKRIEEQQTKMQNMRRQQEEQRATLVVRRAIQKVRTCTPETLEASKTELDEALAKELNNTGAQSERVKEEAEKGRQEGEQRCQQIEAKRKEEEERKVEEEKKRQEAMEKAKKLLSELEQLIEVADGTMTKLKEEAEPFNEAERAFKENEVVEIDKSVEEAGIICKSKLKECTDFILAHGPEMKDPPGTTTPTDASQRLSKLLQRINQMKRTCETTLNSCKHSSACFIKKAKARHELDKLSSAFTKYDKDGDGMLSRREVQQYSKGEFNFTLPVDAVDLIFDALVKGTKGVAKEDFHYLMVSVGIAREKEKDAARRAEREAQEQKIAEMRAALEEKLKETTAVVAAAEEMAGKVTGAMKIGADVEATATLMMEKADDAEKLLADAREGAESSKKQISQLGEDEDVDKEIESWLKSQAAILSARTAKIDKLLKTGETQVSKFRENAKKKEMIELVKLKTSAVSVIKFHQRTKKLTNEGLFDEFNADSEGRIDESTFMKFFETCEKEKVTNGDAEEKVISGPGPEELSRVFNFFDEDDEGCISKSQFLRLAREYMKVSKDAVVTSEMLLKDAKTLRRLEIGEVVEILEGPIHEEATDCMRVRTKVMKDGLEGWITLKGNQGSVFLEEGGGTFKVVKETILTESFEIGASKETGKKFKDRKLKEGELLEVCEWPTKQESTGLTRMMCRAMSDGLVGWATTVGNTGNVFIEGV
mmetsp:Transcript_156952/g.285652  ORF Transcript_156952/g.285652 Transcript_156952/m.285652 type:complete len:771 (-) Transcript_156952:163-2475(-)